MKESPNALMKYENQEKPIISELNNLNISKLQKMEPNNGFNNYTNNSWRKNKNLTKTWRFLFYFSKAKDKNHTMENSKNTSAMF